MACPSASPFPFFFFPQILVEALPFTGVPSLFLLRPPVVLGGQFLVPIFPVPLRSPCLLFSLFSAFFVFFFLFPSQGSPDSDHGKALPVSSYLLSQPLGGEYRVTGTTDLCLRVRVVFHSLTPHLSYRLFFPRPPRCHRVPRLLFVVGPPWNRQVTLGSSLSGVALRDPAPLVRSRFSLCDPLEESEVSTFSLSHFPFFFSTPPR